jgi:subtilase family protein
VASFFARLRLGALTVAAALTLLAGAGPAHAGKPKAICPALGIGFMHCNAFDADPAADASPRGVPAGWGPAGIQSAYGLTSTAATWGADQWVAIVDAYDNPDAEADLATYRSSYGLPPCTTANGCFVKVNQYGGKPYPAPDSGWASEISLDLDMVSATCPQCGIILVEANSNSTSDLGAAINRAAVLGATQISNSWGGGEWSYETSADGSYFNHPGVAITASSGDDGYGVEWPAASPKVIAVGGTSLYTAANTRGFTETAWNLAGSGCSAYEPKPAWQTDSNCAKRAVADVAAVADPYTGVAVYDGGWDVYGGTSAAAPIVAAAYALTGSAASTGSFAYDHTDWFNDVTSGSNGSCGAFTYLCTALAGFDGPTGLGTPNSAHPTGTPPTGRPPVSGGGGGSTSGGGTTTTPPPPPTVTTAAPPRSSVSVRGGSVSVSRSGKLSVKISCGAAADCDGLLTLQSLPHRGVLITLARARFHIAAGSSRTITLKLSRSKLRTLNKTRRLRAYGTAADTDGSTAQGSLTLKAPPKRRAKRSTHR